MQNDTLVFDSTHGDEQAILDLIEKVRRADVYKRQEEGLVMAGFMCDIVTPVAKLVSDEVELVVVPGVEGEMGFLKGHAPLVSVLADGEARVKAVGASETVHLSLIHI